MKKTPMSTYPFSGKNKLIISSLALIALGALAYTTGRAVYAEDNANFSPVVERLIQRFNLNRNEVGSIVSEVRTERQAEARTRAETRLSESVANGNLTEDQKNKILAKLTEEQRLREQYRSLSPEERREKMQERHKELEKWAEANGIDFKYVMGMGRMKGGMGFGTGGYAKMNGF